MTILSHKECSPCDSKRNSELLLLQNVDLNSKEANEADFFQVFSVVEWTAWIVAVDKRAIQIFNPHPALLFKHLDDALDGGTLSYFLNTEWISTLHWFLTNTFVIRVTSFVKPVGKDNFVWFFSHPGTVLSMVTIFLSIVIRLLLAPKFKPGKSQREMSREIVFF